MLRVVFTSIGVIVVVLAVLFGVFYAMGRVFGWSPKTAGPTTSVIIVTATPSSGGAIYSAPTSPASTSGGTGIILKNITQNWEVVSMTAATHAHMPGLQFGDQMRVDLGIGTYVINYGGINGKFVVSGPISFCWIVNSEVAVGGAGIYRLETLTGTTGWEAAAKSAPIGYYPIDWEICH